jgi:4'-phosphopantetheinyl transferase EntD
MNRRALSTLFPRPVATADLWNLADASALVPEEMDGTERMVPKRLREYTAGRDCGRRALRKLGYDAAIPRGERGLPRWPAGTIGTITHTHGYAAAAVTERSAFSGIGLDAETIGRLTPNLWPQVFTAGERGWLDTLDQDAQATFATVIFSAKEAFYKSQFVPYGLSLGFQEAEVTVGADTFMVRSPIEREICGRFCVGDDKVLTAVVIG